MEYRARYTNGIAALLTRIASSKPDDYIDNVPFLNCGSVLTTRAAINSYYGVERKRDAPTVLAAIAACGPCWHPQNSEQHLMQWTPQSPRGPLCCSGA